MNFKEEKLSWIKNKRFYYFNGDAGWYENGKLLDNLTEKYSFIVLSNRALEAKFIPNNLLITDIELFGNLQLGETLTFTASTEGGNQPYQWEFCIYKEDQICYSNNNTSINFCEWLPTETGSYTVVVNVTDASNFSVSYSKQFIVIWSISLVRENQKLLSPIDIIKGENKWR